VVVVPNHKVFHEINKNKTAIHVCVFLSHYFDHIPNSAELQNEEFNCVRCIVTKQRCTSLQPCTFNDDNPH
jgi:hypothetical protein